MDTPREDFRDWLRGEARWVHQAGITPMANDSLRPLCLKLCGALLALRLLEPILKPTHICLFQDAIDDERMKPVEIAVNNAVGCFLTNLLADLIPKDKLPDSEDGLLRYFIAGCLNEYFPAWLRRWGKEETDLLDTALRRTTGVTAVGKIQPDFSDALNALARTPEIRVIRQRLGLVTQPETRSL